MSNKMNPNRRESAGAAVAAIVAAAAAAAAAAPGAGPRAAPGAAPGAGPRAAPGVAANTTRLTRSSSAAQITSLANPFSANPSTSNASLANPSSSNASSSNASSSNASSSNASSANPSTSNPSSSSAGGGGGGAGPSSDLTYLFECPVCFDFVLPPIMQCSSGHLVCEECRAKLSSCPTCRGPLANIRNLAMEKLASNVKFPCKHSNYGCTASLLYMEKPEHEESCERRPYQCPSPGASCQWQGTQELVMQHLMISHRNITMLQGEDIVFLASDINLPGAADWMMVQSCFGRQFKLVIEKQEKYDGEQQFFAIVQMIGSRREAVRYIYRLDLRGYRRRLTWVGMPHSIHDDVTSVINNADCLVFDTSTAQLFTKNGHLSIHVTISVI